MQIRTILVVMLAPLILLSGCAHRQSAKRFNKKQLSYHLTEQTTDDSKAIDNIRVSCKKNSYIKKSDCTPVHMTINNKSDSACSFDQSDLNVPLLAQNETEKMVRTSEFRKALKTTLPIRAGIVGFLALPIGLSIATKDIGTFFQITILFSPFCLLAGAALAGTIYGIASLIPNASSNFGITYICENNACRVLQPNKTQSMLLLTKGHPKELSITIHTDNGPIDYTLQLGQ